MICHELLPSSGTRFSIDFPSILGGILAPFREPFRINCPGFFGIDFFSDFTSNASTTDSSPVGSIGSRAFTEGSLEKCAEHIFKYYYFIINEYIFPKIQNDNDIDFLSFKKNFSNAVYEKIDEVIIYSYLHIISIHFLSIY